MRRALGVAAVLVVACVIGLIRPDLPAAAVAERYASGASQFVEVGGLDVHVRDQGSGPALVLLHGSNASLHTWDGWADELSDRFRVVTLDLPGHGLTGPDPRQRYDTDEMARFVDGFADVLGLRRFSIGGNSMGGAVAWHYAALHPDRVERLILVDAAGYPRQEPAPLVFRVARLPVLGELLTLLTPDALFEQNLRDVYGDPDQVTDELVDRYAALNRREGNRRAAVARLRAPERDDTELLATISAPTLVLWGAQDSWIQPEHAEHFAQDIPDAEVIVYEGLGHVPMEEDPVRTAADVRAFLGSSPRPRTPGR